MAPAGDGHLGRPDVPEVQLAYEDIGTGPALLFIHGATTTAAYDWGPVIPFLDGYRRVAVDLRAHGRSGGEPDEISTSVLHEDVCRFADGLGLERFAVVASSHGGLFAIRLAAERPASVVAVVLVGFTPWVPEVVHLPPSELEARWPSEISGLHGSWRPDDHWQRLLARLTQDRVADAGETAAVAGHVTAPTLFVIGDRDPFVPLELAGNLQHVVGGESQVCVVPGEGHQVQRQAPDLFAMGIRRFLCQVGWIPRSDT